jgi:dipeptidyl-peptidase-4
MYFGVQNRNMSTQTPRPVLNCLAFFAVIFSSSLLCAQIPRNWAKDGIHYYELQDGGIKIIDPVDSNKNSMWITKTMLTPVNANPISIVRFSVSVDGLKILINTNTKKVWRYDTRGDYWLYDTQTKRLKKLGSGLPEASLMFAKFSPDGSKVAYVSGNNIYVEQLLGGNIKQLTNDGTNKLINGTFDWAYEEEFQCRDGFRWSPDGRKIAYWQIDASKVKSYLMLNTTDSIYPFVKPVEYPVAGEPPSPFKIGVINADGGQTRWMEIPTDPVLQSYVPRMEWADNNTELIIQHLNRQQNQSNILLCDAVTGKSNSIHQENDTAWIDVHANWDLSQVKGDGWVWLKNGKSFVWASEKDGWRHLFQVSREGKERLITTGSYDVMELSGVDEKSGYVYFEASPENATQLYLYRARLDGSGKAERLTPASQPGTHYYDVSPNCASAANLFTNYYTGAVIESIALPSHKSFDNSESVNQAIKKGALHKPNLEFFKVKTIDGVEMDGWIAKPTSFDAKKKYPVVFYVYSEPAEQVVTDTYGAGLNWLYDGSMADDGYIYVSLDNRGTPAPKGRDWRKSIYKAIGTLNEHDQAMAAKEILKWPYIDTSRVAVWGWSGGGSCTLNLMFQYPEIYKTGIAIAASDYQLAYDNIYQERYMGVPSDSASREIYIKGSPTFYAKNLRGNLLYIHGTGDDNCHIKNAEMLINELIKYNKQFQLMEYPNRTHNIDEGEGTTQHLHTLYTQYLKEHCPPGGK